MPSSAVLFLSLLVTTIIIMVLILVAPNAPIILFALIGIIVGIIGHCIAKKIERQRAVRRQRQLDELFADDYDGLSQPHHHPRDPGPWPND